MKKTIFALALIGSLVANADYLYWMVDTPATGANDVSYDWTTAVLKQDGKQIGIISFDVASELSSMNGYAYSELISDDSTSSFVIELYNSSTEFNDSSFLAQSSLGTYSVLAAHIFANGGMSYSVAGITPAAGSFAVPEPTSGLLFLLGGMLLGLKRRRQV